MSKKRTNKTSHEQIADYWFKSHSGNEYALLDETELNIDACDCLTNCWRCGNERKLEKCHIVPHALGGSDSPDNYVLLCKSCHLENPNVSEKEYMIDWLKRSKTTLSVYGLYDWSKAYDEVVESRNDKQKSNFGQLSIEVLSEIKCVTVGGKLNHATRVAMLNHAMNITGKEKHNA